MESTFMILDLEDHCTLNKQILNENPNEEYRLTSEALTSGKKETYKKQCIRKCWKHFGMQL